MQRWLFDDDPEPVAASPEFLMAPHRLFLAWPDTLQLEHCAARDEANARLEADAEVAEFLWARAAWYRSQLRSTLL